MSKMNLAILNGNVVIPDNGVYKLNVYVKDGKISTLTDEVLEAAQVVDATGKYVAPGIIDPHVHIGCSSPFEVDVQTETKAALVGGVTTLGSFIGGKDSFVKTFPAMREMIDRLSYTDVIPHFAIQTEEQLSEIQECVKMGITSFKVYMNGITGMVPWVRDDFIIRVADEMKKSGKNCILACHCEHGDMVEHAEKDIMKKKPAGATIVDFADIHPEVAELEAVNRFAAIGAYTGVPVYIVHLVRAKSVELLEQIRFHNPLVSVETVTPYLALNKYSPQGNKLKMKPPFQDPEDTEGLWAGIARGVIDTLGTDNTTNNAEEKNLYAENFWDIGPGYAAVEWHLPVALSEGVNKRGVPIERVIACMTKNPAQKYGIYPQKGCLTPGSDADIVIIDLEKERVATEKDNVTRSDFCIYEGINFKGWPVMTIKGGVIVVQDGKVVDNNRYGKFLPR